MENEKSRKHVLRCCNDKVQGVSNCAEVEFTDEHVVISDPDVAGCPTIKISRSQFEHLAKLYDEDAWEEV